MKIKKKWLIFMMELFALILVGGGYYIANFVIRVGTIVLAIYGFMTILWKEHQNCLKK